MKLSSTSKWAIACAALLVTSIVLGVGIVKLSHEKGDMLKQLERLKASDKKSFIVKQISQQMGEIAFGQKAISDKRRAEAEAQTLIAENMRLRADEERRNALIAEGQAVEASKVAQREQREANEQRRIAEASRNQAVAAKNRADTLAYIALGRSLATKSLFQFNAGNYKMAAMLAYYSWLFTTRYGGSVYDGTVFSAINKFAETQKVNVSKAGLTSLVYSDKSGTYICTKYGEVKAYKKGYVSSETEETIFADKSYDFRDGLFDQKGQYWALDVNGRLLKVTPQKQVVTLPGKKFFRLLTVGESFLCAISQTSIYVIPLNGTSNAKLVATGRYTAAGYRGEKANVVTATGDLLTINENGKLDNKTIHLDFGKITTLQWSSSSNVGAYGNTDGEITVVDKNNHKLLTISAHKSTVSRIRFNNDRILSAGYDGFIYLFNIHGDKYESTTLASESTWIRTIQTGDDSSEIEYLLESGQYGYIVIDTNFIIEQLREYLIKRKSSMSIEDWNYYIGPQIPYEKI